MKCIEAISVACKHIDAADILQRALHMAELREDHALIGRLKKSIKSPRKSAALAKVEVTTDNPTQSLAEEDPRWQSVREGLGTLRELGRSFLEAQAWLGWYLACLKKDHGVQSGRPKKNSASLAEFRPWPELVREKTDLSDRTADRFIQLYEATMAKLKRGKTPEQKAALAILKSGNPLAVPDDQRGPLRDVIASLCVGETQASLLEELKVVPTPAMPAKTPAKKDSAEQADEAELARHHWETVASAIFKAREGNGPKLLHLLPPVSSEPGQLSLTLIHDEAAAFLEDVKAALAAHAKPAKAKPEAAA
jgi:hypothetical protein